MEPPPTQPCCPAIRVMRPAAPEAHTLGWLSLLRPLPSLPAALVAEPVFVAPAKRPPARFFSLGCLDAEDGSAFGALSDVVDKREREVWRFSLAREPALERSDRHAYDVGKLSLREVEAANNSIAVREWYSFARCQRYSRAAWPSFFPRRG
jgi:hypothetical protein